MSSNQPLSVNTSASSISSSSRASRSSTPPTEISSALSSPTFAPPIETEASIRRRQQSDQASSEIGKRLLKGWAMLAEECPGLRCYGVPLVRPPKAGGGKDARKVCVVCGTTYITELDAGGWERLIPLDSAVQSSADEVSVSSSSRTTAAANKPNAATPAGMGIDVPRYVETPTAWAELIKPSNATGESTILASTKPLPSVQPLAPAALPLPLAEISATTKSSLARAGVSVEDALNILSSRLEQLNSQVDDLNSALIADIADAIRRVAGSLTEVRRLQEQLGV